MREVPTSSRDTEDASRNDGPLALLALSVGATVGTAAAGGFGDGVNGIL